VLEEEKEGEVRVGVEDGRGAVVIARKHQLSV